MVAQAVEAETKPQYASGGQKYGGTLKIGLSAGGGLDPHIAGLADGESVYGESVYDNVAEFDYDGITVVPDVVKSWEMSADLTTWTLKVQEGIKFHHGPELTSADVKFTLERILDPATASPTQGQIAFIQNITTPDAYTVVVEAEGPHAAVIDKFTNYHMRVVPNGITNDELSTGEWGSGPYTLFEHDPAERTILKRYEDYWKGTGFVDEIAMFYMPESITRLAALKSGAVDFVRNMPFSALEELRADPDIRVASASSGGLRGINMHVNRAPFDNKNLRKAMQYAVDRDFVREATQFGMGDNMNDQPVWINDPLYWKEQPIIKQDIAKAKEYLAMAGYPDGIDIQLHAADLLQMLDMALAFKESVAAAGINVEVVNTPARTFWTETWINECCPFVTVNWRGRPATALVEIMLRTGQAWNDSFYSNPRLDELLGLTNATADKVLQKEYLQEIQEMLIDDVPNLYLMHTPKILPHQARVKGVRVNLSPADHRFDEWWVED